MVARLSGGGGQINVTAADERAGREGKIGRAISMCDRELEHV